LGRLSATRARGNAENLAMEMPRMESPCIKTCAIDPATRLCDGCGRTLDEIAAWSTYTNDDRRRIMAELPSRLRRPTKA